MKSNKLLVVGLIAVILVALSVFFFDPDRLTPENPEGKTIYYTMVINDDVKENS